MSASRGMQPLRDVSNVIDSADKERGHGRELASKSISCQKGASKKPDGKGNSAAVPFSKRPEQASAIQRQRLDCKENCVDNLISVKRPEGGGNIQRKPYFLKCFESSVAEKVPDIVSPKVPSAEEILAKRREYNRLYQRAYRKRKRESTKLQGPEIAIFEESPLCGFYLATSNAGQIMLVCIHGHSVRDGYSRRKVVNAQCVFDEPDGVTLYELDTTNGAWQRIIQMDSALFVGLNYPFHVRSDDVRENSVYITDVGDWDAAIFPIELRVDVSQSLANNTIIANDLNMGDSMRTPIWFRPTTPSLTNAI